MENALYTNLSLEDCRKKLEAAFLEERKKFIIQDSNQAFFGELDGDRFRAEQVSIIPLPLKPVFYGRLETDGKVTKIEGRFGLAPLSAFLGWALAGVWGVAWLTAFLLAWSGQVKAPWLAHLSVFVLLFIAGFAAFVWFPRLFNARTYQHQGRVLDFLKYVLELKAVY